MSTKHHPDEKSKQADKTFSQDETKSLLKKRLIWQHLTQKKIKKAIKSKFKINEIDD
jgi:hypothetical protein